MPRCPLNRLVAVALILFPLCARAGRQGRVDLSTLETPTYTVDGHAFVRHDGDRYNNRPLYCNQLVAIVLAGDKPYALLGHERTILSNLMFAYGPKDHLTWLHHAGDVTSAYRPGRMEWTVKDAGWPGTTVRLEVLPTAEGPGLVAHVHVDRPVGGDRLLFATGAAYDGRRNVLYDWDLISSTSKSPTRGFVPADCEGNVATPRSPTAWTLKPSAKSPSLATGRCSPAATFRVSDASAAADPTALLTTDAKSQPLLVATLDGATDLYVAINGGADDDAPVAAGTPEEQFRAARARADALENRVVVDTPDPWLDAAASAASAVLDGIYRKHVYNHAGMRWGVPLLGWRSIYGPTTYGWHERVLDEARTCLAKQVTRSDKTAAHADPKTLLSSQAPDSRLFGVGRVDAYQPYHYDMQSQFFDQLAHDWRATGGADLEKILLPAIDLHCRYIKDCFDPDGDGAYESYCNTWPTDDQWYNGGGTSEETAYAYTAERTAARLARRAGRGDDAKGHESSADHIRESFFAHLWNPATGHPGAYREQYGLKRLHDSAWLYSIFCPIDAGLLDPEQAAQSLYYTEYDLERIHLPYGGEQCWPSNWVPSLWSVREMWPGDNYALALAYFQTGLPDGGYALLRGTFPQQLLFGPTPGDLGHPAGATDFSDCASPFARTVVEGLFGYRPDYPDGTVTLAPQFPTAWDHASIRTPDFAFAYRRTDGKASCEITLTRPAAVTVELPVNASAVTGVTSDGRPVKYELVPAFHRTLVRIPLATTAAAKLEVTTADTLAVTTPIQITAKPGDPLALPGAHYLALHDPQNALSNAKVEGGTITAGVADVPGHHLLFALTRTGQTRQWRLVKLHTTDSARPAAVVLPGDPRFTPIDISARFNADVREIFHQKYLSPRPETCSLRLASDGYGTWQMVLQKNYKTPDVDLANVSTLLGKDGLLTTPLKVPFLPPSAAKDNVAFTSLWDNYPHRVEFPVHKAGSAIAFLLAGSTNPMEVRIANARLRLSYADGQTDSIDLVPPFNFWSLCPLDHLDYDYGRDAFALPKSPPPTVQLGQNCRAVLVPHRLRPGVELKSVALEALSNQVVIGLMGVTVVSDK